MPAFYSFFKFLLYVTFLLWSCEDKVSPYIKILLLCCAVSVQAHAMKLSVHQTYKFVWLSSTNTGSLLIQRGFSLALSLTVCRGWTWGTFSFRGATRYSWKNASDPLWSLVALWSQQETTHPFHCQFLLEVCWCLMIFVFFYSWLHMAFAGGWSSLVLGSISDCWNPPAPAVSQPSEGGRPHQKSFWWWHVGPATDILVLITDPLYGGLNLFPHSVTNLVRISHSFCFIVVLVSVWHNPPRKSMCSLEACFHILHTSWDTDGVLFLDCLPLSGQLR